MMHPVAFAIFMVVGAAVVGTAVYKEYREYQEYKEQQHYQRSYQGQSQSHSYSDGYSAFRHNNEFDFQPDHDDEEKRNSIDDNEEDSTVRNSSSQINNEQNLRNRKPFSAASSSDFNQNQLYDQDQYELSEIESSVAERKRRLMAEQAFLDREEESLRNRRNELAKNSHDFDIASPLHIHDHSLSSSNSSDDNNLERSMATFNPFCDRFQETSSFPDSHNEQLVTSQSSHNSQSSHDTAILIHHSHIDDSNATALTDNESEDYNEDAQHNTSTSTNSLRYPAPRSSATAESVSSSTGIGLSDSEESWDALSENEWNRTNSERSDDEAHQHHSSAHNSPSHHHVTSLTMTDDEL